MKEPTHPKPLTAVDNVLYIQMISRLHSLSYFASHHFLMGEVDRLKFSQAVGELIRSTFSGLMEDDGVACPPGYCKCFGICVPCGGTIDGELEELIQRNVAQLIDINGLVPIDTKVKELLKSL